MLLTQLTLLLPAANVRSTHNGRPAAQEYFPRPMEHFCFFFFYAVWPLARELQSAGCAAAGEGNGPRWASSTEQRCWRCVAACYSPRQLVMLCPISCPIFVIVAFCSRCLTAEGRLMGPFNMAQHHAILFCPAVSRGRKVDVIDHTDVAGNPEPAEEMSPHELLLKKLQSARPAHSEAQPDQARMSSVF